MARCINDGVVPLVSEELLGGACNRHATLALFLLTIHVKCKSERRLAQALCFRLQFFQFTLWDSTKLKNQPAGCRALATVDVATDDNGQVFLLRICRHRLQLSNN